MATLPYYHCTSRGSIWHLRTYRSLLGGAEAWMCFGFRVEVNPFIYPHYKEGVDTPVETRVDSRQINADLNSRLSLLRCVCVETIKVER